MLVWQVIYSAKFAHLASQATAFGLSGIEGAETKIDMSAVIRRKKAMVDGLIDLHLTNFKNNHVELIRGRGEFVAPKTIEVTSSDGNKRVLKGDAVVISTGSRAKVEPIPGLKEAQPLTHIEMLELTEVPRHLVVLGGGYVGLELAQAMRRFGAEVTVVERNGRVLKGEDEDVGDLLAGTLKKEGITILTSTSVKEVSGTSGTSVTLTTEQNGNQVNLQASHILVAAGREPNTDGIGLDKSNVKLNVKGFIEVDEVLSTTEKGVFAVGDCAGSPHFTHMAFDDFRIVRDELLGKPQSDAKRRSGRQIPSTLFTSPEAAHVGLREHEAKASKIAYRLTKIPMLAFLRTRTLGPGDSEGFAKALIADDDTILGFSAVGPGVGELLPVVQLAMKKHLPYSDLAELIITHPTLSEGLVALFSAVPSRA